jgi:transposase
MLGPQPHYTLPTEEDRRVFEALVPSGHYLRRAAQVIDFERFRPLMASCYSPHWGRPADEPVLLLKLTFLQYHDRLSDNRVIEQAGVNIAYREFLGLGMQSSLPDPSLLSYFRGRLGGGIFRQIFDDLVAQAREHGLVKDRLRLKDATHVIADVAIPSTIRLVAEVRERLLDAIAAYEPSYSQGQRGQAEMIRAADQGATAQERLETRVTHLREVVAWSDTLIERLRPTHMGDVPAWQRLEDAAALAHKVLDNRDRPDAGDAVVSAADPDARFGRHHVSYCGYLLDIAMDAESELITSLNVLPANGDEAADAAVLIQQEEQAQGNDVEAISADSALFQGEKLRELTAPEGLDLEVFVPPTSPPPTPYFTSDDFTLDEGSQTVTCPAGQQSTMRDRNEQGTGWIHRFRRSTCAGCPLQAKCLAKLPKQHGRSVTKNDYAAEYAAARAKAQTPEFAAIRRIHRKVERKLAELVRWHGGRRARWRGKPKVLVQELITAFVVNVKRIVEMLSPAQPQYP